MSLQLAAQHMASRGRGPDTMLVHMAPSEVNALQTVAKAHGGSLTVNPDTGLPEAGFLSSILPMIAGVGLTAISGGTLSPVMAGLLTGGGTALATGNLQKGLMAGLGAYGGAGIGSALSGAGAVQGLNAAGVEAAAAGQAEAARQLADTNMMAKYQAAGISPEQVALSAQEFGSNQMTPAARAALVKPSGASTFDNMISGFKGLGNEAGRDQFMKQIGGAKGLFKSGYTAALPVMMAGSGETASPPAESGRNPYEYDFTPGYTGPVRTPGGGTRFFDPRYVLRRAEGGETYADGGNTNMTGESDEYYRYLMGLAPAPRPYTPAPVTAFAATQADTAPLTVTNPMAARRDVNYSDSMAFDDPNNPQNPNSWGNLTPIEQAQFYFINPGLAKLSGVLQDGFGRTIPGAIQNYFVPGFVQQEKDIVSGKMLNDYMKQYDYFGNPLAPTALAAMSLQDQANINAQGSHAEGQVDTGPMGGNGADNDDAGIGAAIAAAEANAVAEGMSSVAESSGNPDGPSSAGDYARGGLSSLAAFAQGGYNLGDYSDGGRLLRGPGDGVSDSIPASIGNKRPARLADGEFVVPARIVSELGNGSTEAGARKLYAMMDRVQKTRGKTTGKGRVAVNSRSDRYLPA
jgi:hypothetical protein